MQVKYNNRDQVVWENNEYHNDKSQSLKKWWNFK